LKLPLSSGKKKHSAQKCHLAIATEESSRLRSDAVGLPLGAWVQDLDKCGSVKTRGRRVSCRAVWEGMIWIVEMSPGSQSYYKRGCRERNSEEKGTGTWMPGQLEAFLFIFLSSICITG